MKSTRLIVLTLLLLLAATALAQMKITIPAGTPEDKQLTTISNEQDAQKRIEMYQQFVETYAGNPAAVAYGNWQLAQQYRAGGQNEKALEHGDLALAAMPDVLDIIVMQADVAQHLRQPEKAFDYVLRGAAVIAAIAKQPQPEGVDQQEWANRLKNERIEAQPSFDYLETVAFNAIQDEKDPKLIVASAEKFHEAFPESRFADGVTAKAIETLQASRDLGALAAFGEKALAVHPDSLPTLVTLAYALAEDGTPAQLAKAAIYSKKAIGLAKVDDSTPKDQKVLAGLAHYSLGLSLLKEQKTTAAIPEFKTATGLFSEEPQQKAIALYRLGYAYAKLKRTAEAKQALNDCIAIEGPLQGPARDLLAQVGPARKR